LQSLQFAHRTARLLIQEVHLFGTLQDESAGLRELKPFANPAKQFCPHFLF
jgi:hypothetical protein